jgi:hypothetical protein
MKTGATAPHMQKTSTKRHTGGSKKAEASHVFYSINFIHNVVWSGLPAASSLSCSVMADVATSRNSTLQHMGQQRSCDLSRSSELMIFRANGQCQKHWWPAAPKCDDSTSKHCHKYLLCAISMPLYQLHMGGNLRKH